MLSLPTTHEINPRVTPDETRSIATNHVVSSNLTRVGYQGTTLYVGFTSGSVYLYEKVPYIIFAAMLAAESAGKFLNSRVKGTYNYRPSMLDPFDEPAREGA